jgi:hypothetical protein
VVKEFHPVTRSGACVIWDGALPAVPGRKRNNTRAGGAARNVPGIPAAGDAATENALRLTSSLCHALAQRGQPCMLLRLDEHPVCVSSASRGATEYSTASYASGGGGLSSAQSSFQLRCSEVLADAAAERKAPLAEALGTQITRLPSAGDVYLVTASLSEDIAHAAGLLVRRGSRLAVALVETAATPAGQSAVYREQAKRLAMSGARVVTLRIPPAPVEDDALWRAQATESRESGARAEAQQIRSTLLQLLDEHAALQDTVSRNGLDEVNEYSQSGGEAPFALRGQP